MEIVAQDEYYTIVKSTTEAGKVFYKCATEDINNVLAKKKNKIRAKVTTTKESILAPDIALMKGITKSLPYAKQLFAVDQLLGNRPLMHELLNYLHKCNLRKSAMIEFFDLFEKSIIGETISYSRENVERLVNFIMKDYLFVREFNDADCYITSKKFTPIASSTVYNVALKSKSAKEFEKKLFTTMHNDIVYDLSDVSCILYREKGKITVVLDKKGNINVVNHGEIALNEISAFDEYVNQLEKIKLCFDSDDTKYLAIDLFKHIEDKKYILDSLEEFKDNLVA